MNRVILIGNGFDLAHKLKTRYQDFIDDFWEKEKAIIRLVKDNTDYSYKYEDEIIQIRSPLEITDLEKSIDIRAKGYDWFKELSTSLKHPVYINGRNIPLRIEYKNIFLKIISEQRKLQNWVDIEEEYYLALYECLNDKLNKKVRRLNEEFSAIQKALEGYLMIQTEKYPKPLLRIKKNIFPEIYNGDFDAFRGRTLLLSFNYTTTEKSYIQRTKALLKEHGITTPLLVDVIHIHGELNSHNNPMIFGYGDEVGDKYKIIEDKNENIYLENIKSFKYSDAYNYKNLLKFIEDDKYEIFIMGHSCGISDRTLLKVVFEHRNCVSIKIFYHKRGDDTDNYGDIYKNISRNFSDKSLMRDRIVVKPESRMLS